LRRASVDTPWLATFEDPELADLLAGDIPYFAARAGRSDITSAKGKTLLPFGEQGRHQHRDRIGLLAKADCERQGWLIRVAMTDLAEPQAVRARRRGLSPEPTTSALIRTAAQIGDRLCRLAIWDGDQCTWLVPNIANAQRLITTAAGFELYEGLAGIAFFLGHLSKITGQQRYGRCATGAILEALGLYRSAKGEDVPLGAFEGAGGIAYALVHLAHTLRRPDWASEAAALISTAARRARHSSELDVISGLAGLVLSGLAVARCSGDGALIEALAPAAHRLRRFATARQRGRAASAFSDEDAGIAHGRAGAGWALCRWGEVAGNHGYCVDGRALNRADLDVLEAARQRHAPGTYGQTKPSWCRGRLGVALIALSSGTEALHRLPRNWLVAVADEIIRGHQEVLCLCHGSLGALELLDLMIARGLLRRSQSLRRWRRSLLARLAGGDWVADTAHRLESPGLMRGLAGTGYTLLRLASGYRLPSVLSLEVPRP
jgi:lantibiotic modifying enzyme